MATIYSYRYYTLHDEYEDEDTLVQVRNDLFGVPLYGFYVFAIDKFAEGDIKGLLLNIPLELLGPYDTRQDANKAAISYMNGSSENSQPA